MKAKIIILYQKDYYEAINFYFLALIFVKTL